MVSLVTVTRRESDPRQGLNGAVAAILNGERTNAPLSYDELAEVSGINRQTLLRLLSPTNKERRHIDVDKLSVLAAVFNMTPAQVVTAAQERLGRSSSVTQDEAQ